MVRKVALVEEASIMYENEDEGIFKPSEGEIADEDNAPDRILSSPTWVVMTTKRMLPGPCGIIFGAVMGSTFSKIIGHFTEYSHGAFPSLMVGVPSAVICALSINSIMEKSSLVACLFSGTAVMIAVAQWNELVAIVVGCIVGVIVGSAIEERTVRQKFAFDKWHRIEKQMAKDERERQEKEDRERLEEQQVDRLEKLDKAVIEMLALKNLNDESEKKLQALEPGHLPVAVMDAAAAQGGEGTPETVASARDVKALTNERDAAEETLRQLADGLAGDNQASQPPEVSNEPTKAPETLRPPPLEETAAPDQLALMNEESILEADRVEPSPDSALMDEETALAMASSLASPKTEGLSSVPATPTTHREKVHKDIVDGFNLEQAIGLFGVADEAGSDAGSPPDSAGAASSN